MRLVAALLLTAIAWPVQAQTIAPAPAPAASDPSLPPIDLVDSALDEAPSVKQAAAKLEAANAHARVLNAGPHEFELTGGYTNRSIRNEPGSNGAYDEFDATVLRAIRLPGKAAADRQIGGYEVQVAQNMFEDARHQAALTLAGYWYDWLNAVELEKVASAAVAADREILSAVSLQVRYKDAGALDADRARLALAMAESDLAAAKGEVARTRAQLAASFPNLPLPGAPPAVSYTPVADAMMEEARGHILGRSHEIRAAEAEDARLQAVARRARLERVGDPSIGLRTFSERSGRELGVGIVGVIPFGGGFRKPAADQAAAEARAGDQALAQVRRDIEATADTDLADARGAAAAWQAAHDAVTAATSAADRLQVGLKLGGVNLADLLYARRQQQDAARAEVQARVRASRTLTKLRIDGHLLWAKLDADDR